MKLYIREIDIYKKNNNNYLREKILSKKKHDKKIHTTHLVLLHLNIPFALLLMKMYQL